MIQISRFASFPKHPIRCGSHTVVKNQPEKPPKEGRIRSVENAQTSQERSQVLRQAGTTKRKMGLLPRTTTPTRHWAEHHGFRPVLISGLSDADALFLSLRLRKGIWDAHGESADLGRPSGTGESLVSAHHPVSAGG